MSQIINFRISKSQNIWAKISDVILGHLPITLAQSLPKTSHIRLLTGALVWLFPGKDVPITASNILKSLASAEQAELRGCVTPVRYFSSVPYVLQMISAESEGMKMLQGMDIVGIGGAALPQDAGDSLVHNGVNLVSRFGSAECGFLLSSHRDYENDKEWQYLRSQGSELLMFEKQQDGSGLSELVIRPEWPHMAKRNREDGSLATADLFKPHPNIKDAWKYHSRADSQLTLITGKKFDPAPLEAVIASSAILSDVLIFGNGMQSAGALLFRSPESRTMAASQVLDEIWPTIDRLNKEGQAHTRLSRSMLTVMDSETSGLEKSSKGTVLRVQAEKRYEKNIHDSYTQNTKREDGDKNMGGPLVPEHEIPMAVLQIIKIVLGTNDRIAEEADLFSHGVDSVACMAIRAKLQSRVLDPKAPTLPLNVVYDCGNIKRLSKYLVDIRHGRLTESEDEIQLMKDLATQYSSGVEQLESLGTSNGIVEKDSTKPGQDEEKHGEYVLLTGATGALGAHILHLLRSRAKISRITCLVRAASPLAAHERVSKSLIARGKPGLPPFSDSKSTLRQDSASPSATVICSPASLSDRDLALHPSIYTHLTHTTTLIIHAAWAVNFTARLRSFEKDHVAGLSHLLNLAHSSSRNRQSPRFLFLSSTASVTNTPATDHPIPERISTTPTDASPLGYSRSKWVAESICASYSNRVTSPSPQSNPKAPKANIAILRIGQLTSDTEHGIWNISEAWPLMLSTAPALHALPDLGDQALDWLPVDTAAKAVLEVAESMKDVATDDGGVENADTTSPQIFHILNPSSSPTWSDLLAAIKDASPVLDLDVLPPREWLQRLERFEGDLPAKKLVGVWEKAFAGERGGGQVVFGVERAKEVSMVMREVGPLDEMFLERMWRWVEGLAAGCGGKVEGE
ncbi:MAG: hypothetical protein L6R40_003321 [Gallowayella cf. fulva]|nr:MAG: hypothetical protein L6R40_003321 [Xanthomendoza cf. fulva]